MRFDRSALTPPHAPGRLFALLRALALGLLAVFAAPAAAEEFGLLSGDPAIHCGPAAGGATDCAPGPASLPSDTPSLGVGNPLHLASGNKYQREADLPALPGVLGLEVVRHYNSHATPRGWLGRGWTLSYDTRLYALGATVQIVQADGRRLVFSRDPAHPSLCASPDPTAGRVHIERDTRGRETFRWVWPDGRQLRFDAQGFLTDIRAPSGERLTVQRGPAGELLGVTDPQGRRLVVHYTGTDGWRGISALDTPAGRFTYAHDAAGRLVGVQGPDGVARRYHYEDPRHPYALTGISLAGPGPDGRPGEWRLTTYGYDAQGRAVLSAGAAGETDPAAVRLDFAAPGRTVLTDGRGRQTVYRWAVIAGAYRLFEARGAGCAACGPVNVRYRYDAAGQLLETLRLDPASDAPVAAVRRTRDMLGRLTRLEHLTYAAGRPQAPRLLARLGYADDGVRPTLIARPSVVPGKEHTLRITYNEFGQPTAVTASGYSPLDDAGRLNPTPITRTTTYTYRTVNGVSLLTAIDGPRDDVGDILRLDYDGRARLYTLSGPDGRTLTVTNYDPAGRPLRFQVGEQTPLELRYDARGRIIRISQGSRHIEYAYDAVGRLTSLTGPDGRHLALHYNDAGLPTTLEGPDGRRVDFDYDSEGHLTQRRLSDAQGEPLVTVGYLWDAYGRLNAVNTSAGSTHYRYDTHGRLVAVEDPTGARTDLSYNALGQLLAFAHPDLGTTRLHYDAAGQSIGLTDPRSNTTERLKDDFGRVVRQLNPDTGTTRHAYDAAGNRIATTYPDGRTTTRRFDAANRLVEETAPEGTTRLRYTQGRLVEVAGPASHEHFDYDAQGRLIAHTRFLDGHRFTTGYRYDAAGNLAEKHLPDGQTLVYHYYADGAQQGRLRAITRPNLFGLTHTTLIGEIDQDAFDGTTGYLYGNGIRLTRHHDALGRLTALAHSRQLQLKYRHDERGQISGIELDGTAHHYRYDRAGRLTAADTRLGSYRYAYDALGNRTAYQHTGPDGETARATYTYPAPGQGNRLLAVESDISERYAYNAAGSTVQVGDLRYDYDSAQRPVRVYRLDAAGRRTPLAEYTYNRFGERIKKVVYTNTDKPTVTYYLYDGHRLTTEADKTGRITAQYLYLAGRPIIKLEGRAVYALHTDHLGAPRAATDEDGALVWAADYHPFGRAHLTTAHITLNLRLPGQYADAETATHYNYRRDYDPHTGRYRTADPIGLKGGLNTYAYALANPVRWTDPLGLKVWMGEKAIEADPTGQGGHIWLIIQPDNTNELMSLGYNRISEVLDANGRFTLSAFPDASFIRTGKGNLVKTINGDSTTQYRQLIEIKPPDYSVCFTDGRSYDTQFIIDILEAYHSYNDDQRYDGFAGERGFPFNLLPAPPLEDGFEYYNSNSFIAGLLISAGIDSDDIPDPWGIQPGIDKPVPLPSTFM